jgi:hypothetical protein
VTFTDSVGRQEAQDLEECPQLTRRREWGSTRIPRNLEERASWIANVDVQTNLTKGVERLEVCRVQPFPTNCILSQADDGEQLVTMTFE